mgnify:CR=1 FL=1
MVGGRGEEEEELLVDPEEKEEEKGEILMVEDVLVVVLVDVEVEVEVAVEGLLIISILGAKSVRAQKIQKEIQSAVVDKAVVTMAMVLTIDHVRLISTV